MRVCVIGAGKVGCALAIAMNRLDFTISGIYSRSHDSFGSLCRVLDCSLKNSLSLAVANSNVILIAVPDVAIGGVAAEIVSQVKPEDIVGKVFLHLSGAETSEVLEPIARNGGYTGSLHPVQTFADRENGWKGLPNIYFSFEGCNEARDRAEKIVKAFSGNMICIKKEYKALYHAAACMLSNYTVALSYVAGNLLNMAGIDFETGVRALKPLLENTIKNIDYFGSLNALTGPISRGDCGVVAGHMEAISEKSPDTLEIYKLLGRVAVDMALKKGSINSEQSERMYNILL